MNQRGYRKDEGLSTIEALIAVAIFSISTIALASGVFSAYKAARISRSSAKSTFATLAGDAALRDTIGRVRIPYWAIEERIEIQGPSLDIPWYNGVRDHHVLVSTEGSKLLIRVKYGSEIKTSIAIDDCTEASFSPMQDDTSRMLGVKAVYRIGRAETVTLAPFASIQLKKEPR